MILPHLGDGRRLGGAKDSYEVYEHFAHQASPFWELPFWAFRAACANTQNGPIWGANHMEPMWMESPHFAEVERRQLAKVPILRLVAGKSPNSRTLTNPSGLHGLIPRGGSPMGNPPWGSPIGDLPWGLPHGGIPPHGDPPWGTPLGDSHGGSPIGNPPQVIPHEG